MGCMKCGRDVEENQVFCDGCLAVMEQYPVKPGTVVTLPTRRNDPPVRRQPRKRMLSPEERLKKLRRRCAVLSVLLAVSLLLCAFFGWVAVQHFLEDEGLRPGQNYSALETTAPSQP